MKLIKNKRQFGIFLSLVIISITIIHKLYLYLNMKMDYNPKVQFNCFNKKMILKQHLSKAIRYTRSNIVRDELLKAIAIISDDVNGELSEIKYNRINQVEKAGGLQDVCLEEYKGVIDHPLYNLGQIEVKCNKKPFEDVLTFVMIVENCNEIRQLVDNIKNIYNKSQIVISLSSNGDCDPIEYSNVKILKKPTNKADLLNIFTNVRTEYVLFVPNIFHFDNQSRIERLVQMVSYTDVKIAAGGVRLEDGKFSTGCYQMAMKMYTLKLVEGYDMSFNSCLYCDYSPAPFVTRKSFFIEQLQRKNNYEKNIFLLEIYIDLLIIKHGQIVVCPDVMFHTKSYNLSEISRERWLPFVSKFELNRIIFPDGKDMHFSCSESKMSCYKEKGIIVPLCCLKELSDSLKFMNKLLHNQNVTFEVLEGTVMGGLKYNNILLWERDADTNFRVQKIDKLEQKLGIARISIPPYIPEINLQSLECADDIALMTRIGQDLQKYLDI